MNTTGKKILEKMGDSAPTTNRLASAAHEAINEAAVRTAPVESQIRTRAAEAGEKLEASQATATEQVEQSLEKLQLFVKNQPMAAAGIAFAAGVITTVLLRR